MIVKRVPYDEPRTRTPASRPRYLSFPQHLPANRRPVFAPGEVHTPQMDSLKLAVTRRSRASMPSHLRRLSLGPQLQYTSADGHKWGAFSTMGHEDSQPFSRSCSAFWERKVVATNYDSAFAGAGYSASQRGGALCASAAISATESSTAHDKTTPNLRSNLGYSKVIVLVTTFGFAREKN